jgi:hypothetical protein
MSVKHYSDYYVIAHDYSLVPWNGRLFTSLDEAKTFLDADETHGKLMYVLGLGDFMWQLSHNKPSPRVLYKRGVDTGVVADSM